VKQREKFQISHDISRDIFLAANWQYWRKFRALQSVALFPGLQMFS
jgi:hypothetical protein